jgi:PBSX family phage portal protein
MTLVVKSIDSQSPTQKTTDDAGLSEGVIARPYDFATLLEAWQVNPWHQRAINIKVLAAVGLGYNIAQNGEVDEKLRDWWNKLWGGGFKREVLKLSQDYETFGNAYIEVARTGKTVSACYHVPAITMYATTTGYRQDWNNKKVDFVAFGTAPGTEREILHIKQYSPKASIYGVPDWVSALNAIILDANSTEWNIAFFNNNCMPSWAIIVKDGGITPDVEQEIKEFFVRAHKGVGNSHKTMLMSANGSEVIFQRLQADNKDMSFERLKETCRNEVACAHGVPPRLLGIITAGQLGGGGEFEWQLKFFKEGIIMARQNAFEDALSLLMPEGASIRFAEMDVTNLKEDVNAYVSLVGSGIMEPNEARDGLGYAPIEGLDERALAKIFGGGNA